MIKKLLIRFRLFMLIIPAIQLQAQTSVDFSQYHRANEVQKALQQLHQKHQASTQLHQIAASPGGQPISILEIGSNLKNVPSVFVGANFEGNIPISTEGALYLANMILSDKNQSQVKWYILPEPNPDAANGFFDKVKYNRSVNNFDVNNDADESLNEDGFDDLNNDGFITQMRVEDPLGTEIISKQNKKIMIRANTKKGERGVYKIYSEGIDNDGDGLYNEDGEGGINVGINFPHLFPKNKKEAGLYPGQTPEVYAIMKFIYDRPDISMVFTLGSSDFCIGSPKGGRKGDANMDNIKIPSRYAKMLKADASKTYKMDEVIEMLKSVVPAGMEVTPSMVAGMLGLGAAVNPLKNDLNFYSTFSDEYKKYLKEKNFDTNRLDPTPAKDGSFELWAYYHLGVPSFAMNLFTVPKVKETQKSKEGVPSLDEVEEMNKEKFVSLGEEKISTFLTANNAPKRMSASKITEMINSGKFSPKQLVQMIKKAPKPEKEGELSETDKALLAWSDSQYNGKAFVDWEKYNHPTLGEVEIGGYVPYLKTTPPPSFIDSLCKTQLPWLIQLTKKLPEFNIESEKLTDLGAGVYKLEVFIENKGVLPYPIEMGKRNNQPAPVIVVLNGDVEILEGTKRKPLGAIGGNQVKKLSWMFKSDKKTNLSVEIESVVFGSSSKQIKIGG